MKILIEEKIPIFSFTFGVPEAKYIRVLKQNKCALIGTATHLQEAAQLQKSGIDIIVAQGVEAGGHRGTFMGSYEDSLIGLSSLVPQLVDHIQLPIVAAGGIMDKRGVRCAMALGAFGIQAGTAFITTQESNAPSVYKKALLNSQCDQSILTTSYSGKLARGLKNQSLRAKEIRRTRRVVRDRVRFF